MTPTALDRCKEPGDWLRREIETAISEKRNIIPLFFDNFSFGSQLMSKNLTEKLATLRKYNGLDVPANYFDEAMSRLCAQFLNVALDAVLHPISNEASKFVEAQKRVMDQDDSFAWLERLAEKQGTSEKLLTKSEDRIEEEPDWVKQAKGVDTEKKEETIREGDDSFSWLDSLASKQGATEGLLAKSENRLEDEPDWIKQAKGNDTKDKSNQEIDDSFFWLEKLASKQGVTDGLLTNSGDRIEEEPDWVKQAKGVDTEKEEETIQEGDDSFSWLESLASKQGATDGLLTKSEDQLEDEPDWIKQAKGNNTKDESNQEIDDSFSWLESLASKQGTSEKLLTKSEDRIEEEPDWVKRAKGDDTKDESNQEIDDSFSWLESLASKQGSSDDSPSTPLT